MFWNIFYDLCREKGQKPNPIAKELGYSSAVCTKWKNGSLPNSEALVKIADYFSVSVDYLLGRTKKPTGITDGLSEIEEKLLLTFRSLNGEGQEKIVIYADDLADSGKYKKEDTVRVAGK